MPSRAANDSQRDRKRKNADAQAQFRQRRANYISSLEETVTKLEAVVVELQDCLRDAKQETARAINEKQQVLTLFHHLRQELLLREQSWKDAWVKQLPEAPLPVSSPVTLPGSHSPLLSPSLSSCLDPNLSTNYQANLSPQPVISPECASREFTDLQDSPEDNISNLGSASKVDRSVNDEKALIGTQPLWVGSEQIPGQDVSPRLLTKNGIDSILCDPPPSSSTVKGIRLPSKRKARSQSPYSRQSRHSSLSSTHNIQNFSGEIEARSSPSQSASKIRSVTHNLPNLAELSAGLFRDEIGGTSGLPGLVTHSQSNGYTFNDCISSDLSHRSGSPPISNTLAVIKATAFGALRRNRSQRKRGDSHATKVALEALEARGLGLGLQPTMTLSSAHILPTDSPIDEAKRLSMSVDQSLAEEHSL